MGEPTRDPGGPGSRQPHWPVPGAGLQSPSQKYARRHSRLRPQSPGEAVYRARALRLAAVLLSSCLLLAHAACAWSAPVEPPALAGIPVDFILFAATLIGIALFHHHTLPIAVGGLIAISLWKIGFSPFTEGNGVAGWLAPPR